MIDTRWLKEWDIVKIWIEKTWDMEYGWEWYRFTATAIFRKWLFVDWGDIYWSSVYKYKLIKKKWD